MSPTLWHRSVHGRKSELGASDGGPMSALFARASWRKDVVTPKASRDKAHPLEGPCQQANTSPVDGDAIIF